MFLIFFSFIFENFIHGEQAFISHSTHTRISHSFQQTVAVYIQGYRDEEDLAKESLVYSKGRGFYDERLCDQPLGLTLSRARSLCTCDDQLYMSP